MAWLGLIDGVFVATGIGATVGFALPATRWRQIVLPGS
jgi:hypothetical protein